ncbi:MULTISPECIES: MarR family winged helix-turn-helix transcriptional regulator [Methanobacterium]|jgi:DNA-binding MarR family transcriptional regulator|uniref:MarR family transcriptional regulator n=1 Tax=Methanobacterium subterraneum TaxID=59277 RepID=A0A2H4VMK0_9EURY|nr:MULTISPECIES: MarR family transcriptional regulator [Methanobacterium]MBW4257001.1 MarR family transcriptional regulator [Methanobacterium sp. YSL]AUB58338.1 MarR family transcriptional regulator [Methanobacterium sp. MZ-A1]AUB59318.1 MarR family transcriptional regulator [Methanobacterium subterraneum]MCC7560495.1 MarR family transcriptional regulator [Methanobacterium sp.]NMO08876.1 MarR family transcriptional regulator [Methanobacterium subterraneum]
MSLNIPFRGILSIIIRNHFIFMNRELKHLELTEGQVPCIIAISKRPGITQDDLARMFHIDKGTIARAIRKLEEKNRVSKVPDPENRRRYLLSLTKEGEELIPEILLAEKKWENIIFKGFSDEERGELLKGMEKMAENSLETCKNQCKESENCEKG